MLVQPVRPVEPSGCKALPRVCAKLSAERSNAVFIASASFAGESGFRFGNRRFDVARRRRIEFVFILAERFFDRINKTVETISGFDLGFFLLVLAGVRFGILHHLVDFIFRQTGRRRDRDLLLASRADIFCRNVDDAVRVNVERYFDLRNAARCGRNAAR